MNEQVEGRLRIYWRIRDAKKIAKAYRRGWRARHMQWDATGDRVIILWERERLVDDERKTETCP